MIWLSDIDIGYTSLVRTTHCAMIVVIAVELKLALQITFRIIVNKTMNIIQWYVLYSGVVMQMPQMGLS